MGDRRRRLEPHDAILLSSDVSLRPALTRLNLSNNHAFGPDGGTAIAAATSEHASLTELNLENNGLCGLNRSGQGSFTSTAISAIIDRVAQSPITSLSLASNALSDAGTLALVESFRAASACAIAQLDLCDNNIRVEGGKALAALISGMPTLAELNLRGNRLCGVSLDVRTQKRTGQYTAEAILGLADATRGSKGLRVLNLEENLIDSPSRAALEEAKPTQLLLRV